MFLTKKVVYYIMAEIPFSIPLFSQRVYAAEPFKPDARLLKGISSLAKTSQIF